MKYGKILTISAILMAFCTVLVAMFATFPKENISTEAAKPSEISENYAFFPADFVALVNVGGPCPVELDNSFSGVKLVGPAAQSSEVDVRTSSTNPGHKGISIGIKDTFDPITKTSTYNIHPDSLKIIIGMANTQIHPAVELFFGKSKSVSSLNALTGTHYKLNLFLVENCSLEFDVEELTLKSVSGNQHLYPNIVHEFYGKAERLNIYRTSDIVIDASDLKTKNTYIIEAKNSDLKLNATNIGRIEALCNSKYAFLTPPVYQKIKMDDDILCQH